MMIVLKKISPSEGYKKPKSKQKENIPFIENWPKHREDALISDKITNASKKKKEKKENKKAKNNTSYEAMDTGSENDMWIPDEMYDKTRLTDPTPAAKSGAQDHVKLMEIDHPELAAFSDTEYCITSDNNQKKEQDNLRTKIIKDPNVTPNTNVNNL